MADKGKTLGRIHRVRTLQLTLARAEESRAHAAAATENALSARIAQLAEAVTSTSGHAVALGAAAHYRQRLQQSAQVAANRVRGAEADIARAAEGTRAAKRDQGAVEKLLERADADALRRAMRRLEETPPGGKRHDPC
jgi:hypothetical protein